MTDLFGANTPLGSAFHAIFAVDDKKPENNHNPAAPIETADETKLSNERKK